MQRPEPTSSQAFILDRLHAAGSKPLETQVLREGASDLTTKPPKPLESSALGNLLAAELADRVADFHLRDIQKPQTSTAIGLPHVCRPLATT